MFRKIEASAEQLARAISFLDLEWQEASPELLLRVAAAVGYLAAEPEQTTVLYEQFRSAVHEFTRKQGLPMFSEKSFIGTNTSIAVLGEVHIPLPEPAERASINFPLLLASLLKIPPRGGAEWPKVCFGSEDSVAEDGLKLVVIDHVLKFLRDNPDQRTEIGSTLIMAILENFPQTQDQISDSVRRWLLELDKLFFKKSLH
ncbi:MAG: hypothetical protein UW86_C0005G0026 [Microgenomates group bacterium GW2011_GWA1_Microgenomates_45_10]|nr:MAG: hypothetical protein UW69_C0005G0027 [Microgenomates group bacterium GW2011_GWA2_44_7]KKT77616.1 MAG: hypothetical protein UW73_C0016G0026 [Microgenomates group bacterium GW2011_GWB1_44_8]KKT87285.1 MAG: hypothetical protein UW86_C0005G0026 [Microgenomates group bacterium GW2011_GWA1_Microgenomates_45_10]